MLTKITELIPAVRMLFSEKELLSARALPKDICNEIQEPEDFIKLGFSKDGEDVLVIGKSIKSKADLLQLGKEWKEMKSVSPKYIFAEEIGAFVVASSATAVESLIQKTELDSDPDYRRLSGKVVIITGGAQGFGAGIAESLFVVGASIVIADLNEEVGGKLVEKLNLINSSNRALFIKADVSDPVSVEKLIDDTIMYFGGLDVMISNAGILRAGGLDELTPEAFELMTKVNYTGYFNCAKYASAVMKIQSEYNDAFFSDIIQINSKSGLKGSNRNFAYAGGKFGGIGLTQSFAMELMPDNIKVNSICPGNFFDGPLWSDPEKGLFVQYLNAGKVPGAKSIEDVKHFYEKQVPAGRGCEVKDVARAIFYVIEQEYETGQAIPVTGGQIMLH